MTNNKPTLMFILVNNPSLALPPSETITVFEDKEGQLHIPDSENKVFATMLHRAIHRLDDQYHQGVIVAVEVRPGTKIDAYLYSTPQPDASGRRRRRRRRRATCD